MAITVYYPLDLTGNSLANKVQFPITLAPSSGTRAFAHPAGAFYAKSFELRDAHTPTIPLIRGLDYELTYLVPELVKLTGGMEVCTSVVVKDHVGGNLTISGNVVGGHYGVDAPAIEQAIKDIDLSERPLEFYRLLNLPETFRAAPHYKDVGNIFGFEYIVSVLTQTLNTISVGTRGDVDTLVTQLGVYTDALLEIINTHVAAEGNVHNLTIHQLDGLSRLEIQALLDALNAEYDTLIDTLGIQGDHVSALSLKLDTIRNEFNALNAKYSTLEIRVDHHDTDVSDLQEQIATIRQALAVTTGRVDVHDDRLALLDAAVALLDQKHLAVVVRLLALEDITGELVEKTLPKVPAASGILTPGTYVLDLQKTYFLPTTGLVKGDRIALSKLATISPILQCTIPIVTAVGSDVNIVYNYNLPIIICWTGTRWEI